MSKEYYIAIVTRNVEKATGKTDDAQTAAVSSKTLMGAVYFQCNNMGDGEYPIPARPTFGFAGLNGGGLFWVPKVGDYIMVMFDTQMDQPQPYYICSLYTTPDTPMHEEWEVNYPNRMGLISNVGHKLIFDDTEYDELIRIEHALGNMIEMDYGGNYYEKVIASRFSEVAGFDEHEVRKDLNYTVIGSHRMDVRRDYNLLVKGNHSARIKGNYELVVDGNYTFSQKALTQNFGTVTQNVKGGRTLNVDGGYNETIGGCLGHAVISNYSRTVGGNQGVMVAGNTSMTYGMGYTETIPVGNKTTTMLLGNYTLSVTAGNIELMTLAGSAALGNALGGVEVSITGACDLGNLLGGLTISEIGDVELKSPLASLTLGIDGSIDVSNAVGGLSIDAAGTISLSNPLGEFSMDPTGTGKFGGSAGYVQIDPAGNVTVFGTTTTVGAGGGCVLTNLTDPVIDTITGAPHIGLPTFTAG